MTTIATIAVFVFGANVALSLWRHNLDAAAGWACAAVWASFAAWGGTA